MAWMTKDLALDLLAILIGAGQSAYNRINDAPGEWPPAVEAPAEQSAVAPQQTPTDTPAPETQPQQAPAAPAAAPQQHDEAPAPEIDAQALLVEAKTLLHPISQGGGRDWIKNTLLPQFGVQKLSDVPADKLPQLIEVVKRKQQEMNQ